MMNKKTYLKAFLKTLLLPTNILQNPNKLFSGDPFYQGDPKNGEKRQMFYV